MPAGKRKEEIDDKEDNDVTDRAEGDERQPEGGLLDDIYKKHISKVSRVVSESITACAQRARTRVTRERERQAPRAIAHTCNRQ